MSTVLLWAAAACLFVLAYRYYSAYTINDGREYVSINKWVLFGHNFAVIARAGPLVRPILVAQCRWGPGFL